jgi:hypothetical protein
MKSIWNLLAELHSTANAATHAAFSERLQAMDERYDQMRIALERANYAVCPICEEWALAEACGVEYAEDDIPHLLQEDKACTHGGDCRCGMPVLDCCQYPVWKREPGYHYEPINMAGLDFLKRLRAKKAEEDKAVWHNAADAIRKAEGDMT